MARSKTAPTRKTAEATTRQDQEQVAPQTPDEVTIRGNLGADPVRRETSNGVAVANFSVAVHDGDNDDPIWYRVVAWRDNAEWAAKRLRTGNLVEITGRPRTRSYIDRNGNEREVSEIVVSRDGLQVIRRAEPAAADREAA